MKSLDELGAAEAVALLSRREITAEALVAACLARIAVEEPRVQAWEHLDPELALAQARRLDALPAPRPPLAGLPVAVKDIIATADMPTCCGSPLLRGHRPPADAACVAALRAAGAVILGKTVTTEFAVYTPGKTRNPHGVGHTPGGSSSGSAAAVAASMVPAALGTQTAGSIIRPASFCGVVGYKPSYGLVPMDGVHPVAPSLDTLGVFTRRVADVAVVARALGIALPATPHPAALRVGLCRTDQWPLASVETRDAVASAASRLARSGSVVEELELGPELAGLAEVQETIMAAEAARALSPERGRGEALLSPALRMLLDEGAAVPRERYEAALARAADARDALGAVFARADVLITASAVGEAPPSLATTGDPALNRIWTLLHVPCISLPATTGVHGMPVGVQLVGPPGGDAPLLAAAAFVEERLAPSPTAGGGPTAA